MYTSGFPQRGRGSHGFIPPRKDHGTAWLAFNKGHVEKAAFHGCGKVKP